MADSLAAVVLAAGAGTRLRPLTRLRPKALCPVDNVPLVDRSDRRAHSGHRARWRSTSTTGARCSRPTWPDGSTSPIEEDRALGTAGALGHLREWLAGRPALVLNADAWHTADLGSFVAGWDGERVRLLVVGPAPVRCRPPRSWLHCIRGPTWPRLDAEPSGLYERSWRRHAAGRALDTVAHHGAFHDCGTPGALPRRQPGRVGRRVGGRRRRGGRGRGRSLRDLAGRDGAARRAAPPGDQGRRADDRSRALSWPAGARRCRCRGCGGRWR